MAPPPDINRDPPVFVGLTGAVAAGKSEALAAFARLGAATLSSDAVTHELLGTAAVRERLVERWGEEVVAGGLEITDEDLAAAHAAVEAEAAAAAEPEEAAEEPAAEAPAEPAAEAAGEQAEEAGEQADEPATEDAEAEPGAEDS